MSFETVEKVKLLKFNEGASHAKNVIL